MDTTRSKIDHILKKKSIIDYLASKGHQPVKPLSGGRLSYFCPMSWHSEKKPSFIVWTNAEFENFYCFGCQCKYNIIHLVSLMEGITIREAIKKLAEGVDISVEDEHKLASEAFLKGHEINPTLEVSRTLIELSNICNSFLSSVDYDETECDHVDNLWKTVDEKLKDYDFEGIEFIRKSVGGIILKRKEKLRTIENQKRKDKYVN